MSNKKLHLNIELNKEQYDLFEDRYSKYLHETHNLNTGLTKYYFSYTLFEYNIEPELYIGNTLGDIIAIEDLYDMIKKNHFSIKSSETKKIITFLNFFEKYILSDKFHNEQRFHQIQDFYQSIFEKSTLDKSIKKPKLNKKTKNQSGFKI